ncbi:MAG: hypothetical protein M3P44_04660 [Actinomycetota bacterium]|nr:hypothetical protein [Actinomycetota bacterium]
MSAANATVLVVGVGDLGSRILDALARCSVVERLVAGGRDAERVGAQAAQAALIAQLTGGPRRVEAVRIDLHDLDATARTLAGLAPDVIVTAATEYSWWRPARATLPYAAWLPLQLPLVRMLMQARESGAPGARVVSLPFPDATGPILAAEGLAPTVGAGNVAEVAAKLGLLAGDGADVRLVMHHAAERLALSAFGSVAGGGAEPGEPPWAARVSVAGAPLAADRVGELFHARYQLPDGRATHALTAASTVAVVAGLLSDVPIRAHAPAPGGLPGGYPVRLSRAGVELDLPEGWTRDEAIAVNAEAGRWDGIAQITPDGTVHLTDAAARALSMAIGDDVRAIAPGDHDALAAAMRERAI